MLYSSADAVIDWLTVVACSCHRPKPSDRNAAAVSSPPLPEVERKRANRHDDDFHSPPRKRSRIARGHSNDEANLSTCPISPPPSYMAASVASGKRPLDDDNDGENNNDDDDEPNMPIHRDATDGNTIRQSTSMEDFDFSTPRPSALQRKLQGQATHRRDVDLSSQTSSSSAASRGSPSTTASGRSSPNKRMRQART
ncbi:hypothetical protein LX36DRAFT_171775 [Colletotrichum falcatum]|nr:hypothetical protein LX36DRAFT_171775 [Colletotrichum falcatum]